MRDHYFIHNSTDNQILIKTRRKKKPSVFCDGLVETNMCGRSFRKLFDEGCIVYMGENTIQVFEINHDLKLSRRGEIKEGSLHQGFDTFNYDNIIVFDSDNTLRVYKARFGSEDIKFEKLQEVCVSGVEGREEIGFNVVADSKGKYFLTSQFDDSSFCSTISVYEMKENNDLKLKSFLDMRCQNVRSFDSLIFLDFYGDELVYVGKSENDDPFTVFSYEHLENELKVAKKFSGEVKGLGDIRKMKKLKEGKLIAASRKNKVVEFDIKFEVC